MVEQWQSFTSMFTKLAEDLKLPRVDTEKLIEAHRKNIDALARSAEAATEGAMSLAVKQREIVLSLLAVRPLRLIHAPKSSHNAKWGRNYSHWSML